MASLWVLLAVCFAAELTDASKGNAKIRSTLPAENMNADCDLHMHKFYRELECTPDNNTSGECPSSYDCPSLMDRKSDRCYFKNKSYPMGFNLTSDMVDFHNPCTHRCQCVKLHEGARFQCSGEPMKACPAAPGCRHVHFLVDVPCCQKTVTVCPSDKPEKAVTCEFEGHTYKEGERFFPGNDMTCTQCVCAAGFNGTLSAPFCHNYSDHLELFGENSASLSSGCIPIFISSTSCFPVSYRCPKPADKVIKAETKVTKTTEKTCQFGNLTMELGDRLSPMINYAGENKGVECECLVPPLPTCQAKGDFDINKLRREFATVGYVDLGF